MKHMEGMKQTTRPLYNNWGTLFSELCTKWLQGRTVEEGSEYIYEQIDMLNKQLNPWQRH